jgi:hypothetical protein
MTLLTARPYLSVSSPLPCARITRRCAHDGGQRNHEISLRDNQRYYQHRFVWFDHNACLGGMSRPFFFNHKGIEFAAGLARHPDGKRLLVSYGVADREAWVATVDAGEVRRIWRAPCNCNPALPTGRTS